MTHSIRRFIGVVILLGAFVPVRAAKILKGNASSTTSTFDFSVGPTWFVSSAGSVASMVVGARQAVAGNTFALSLYSSEAGQFIPLAVSPITLNNVAKQTNPLKGKAIKFICAHNIDQTAYGYFSVINQSASQVERFYLIPSVSLPDVKKPTEVSVSMVQSVVPNDSAGNRAGHIEQLASLSFVGESKTVKNIVIGAVTEAGKDFGEGNSGIAAALYNASVQKDKTINYTLKMLNLSTGTLANRALALNASSAAINIGMGTPVFETITNPVVDMHWDSRLARLYLAIRVTAAAGQSNGARAIVVGRFNGDKLIFDAIVPDAAVLSSNDDVIVGAHNGRSASIFKVRTMRTSTGLDYLIVNGGNNQSGSSGISSVANQIYALPLVHISLNEDEQWRTNKKHGTLADVTVDPALTFSTATPQRFTSRLFTKQATTASQLYTTNSQAALVGGGVLPFLTTGVRTLTKVVADMFVVGDAVYAAVPFTYATYDGAIQQPGLFQSRAIFDHRGCITAWTPWQRVAGTDEYMYAARLDARYGSFWYLTGADSSNADTVKQTQWGRNKNDGLLGGTLTDDKVGLINVLGDELPLSKGGIQGFVQYDLENSGVSGLTTLLATGTNKVVFVKTGDSSQAAGTVKPYGGDFSADKATSIDGTFPVGVGRVFSCSGGVLRGLGPIITAATVKRGQNVSWIVVGGMNGLAILTDMHGNGFAPTTLPYAYTFRKIGNYAFVQKVFGDGRFLYVLTPYSFDRIELNEESFISGNLLKTTLATPQTMWLANSASFSDVMVANKLALLATSQGLYRVGNGSSVMSGVPHWTLVPLGESLGPVYSLLPVESSLGIATAGQVYALSAYCGYDDARLYRLYVQQTSTITDATVRTIGDMYIKDKPSFFVTTGQMRSFYVGDGSVHLITRPVNENRLMALYALPPFLHIPVDLTQDTQFPASRSAYISADISNRGILGRPWRLSASGSWLVYGDFGLRVNE